MHQIPIRSTRNQAVPFLRLLASVAGLGYFYHYSYHLGWSCRPSAALRQRSHRPVSLASVGPELVEGSLSKGARFGAPCRQWVQILLPIALLTLAACASAPPAPTHALQAAETAITSAEQARVADYASIELNEARENLAAARKAVQDKDMARAERLAEQSRVNAELASANARLIRARAINEEAQRSIDVLKQEMQRGPGARP